MGVEKHMAVLLPNKRAHWQPVKMLFLNLADMFWLKNTYMLRGEDALADKSTLKREPKQKSADLQHRRIV